MIDLHNHILPGVDDGARTEDESCRMAEGLVAEGVTGVCCTPHTTEWATAGNAASIRRRVDSLAATLAAHHIDLQLLPGAEAHLRPGLAADVRQDVVPTLNGTMYLLLEFPYDNLPSYFESVVFELRVQGIRPVIAHPERIAPLADDPTIMYRLVQRGCLGQITAISLSGGLGPRLRDTSFLMLDHNLAHLVASDAHDAEPGGRLFALREARTACERRLGSGVCRRLFEETPARIAAGDPVTADEPLAPRRRFAIPPWNRPRSRARHA